MWLVRMAIYRCLEIIELLIVIRCIVSWFPIGRNKFTEFLYIVTEPILEPIRKLTYKSFGMNMMVDLSPIIAFLLIGLLENIVL